MLAEIVIAPGQAAANRIKARRSQAISSTLHIRGTITVSAIITKREIAEKALTAPFKDFSNEDLRFSIKTSSLLLVPK